jgi:hypothetical protein
MLFSQKKRLPGKRSKNYKSIGLVKSWCLGVFVAKTILPPKHKITKTHQNIFPAIRIQSIIQ